MIDLTNPECVSLIGEIRTAVQRLVLVSHAPIQGYNFAPSENGRGDRWRKSSRNDPIPHLGQHSAKGGDSSIPRGDIDRKGDRTPEFRQKSADHFQKTMERWVRSTREYRPSDLSRLLQEAKDAHEAWQKTPLVAGTRPALGDPRWKFWAANCDHTATDIVRWYSVSRSYLADIRKQYRLEKDAA